jgi:LysR family transcriptional activator of nhaA
MNMYNYNHLYYFYTTVKSEGVTSAAKHLHISQPSLSGQLKVLEDFLQIKLFTKVGRKNQLTPEGAQVYGFCRQMFELSEQMHESLNQKIPFFSRKVYIGVSHDVANSFVVEAVSHFLNKYDDELRPKIAMVSGEHEKLAEQLCFKEIDIMISSTGATNPDLVNLESIDVPVNLICAADHLPSFKKMDLKAASSFNTLNQLKQICWVMPHQGSKLRSEINCFFENNDIKGRIVFESDVTESLTRSVVDDVGVAFLPLIYVSKEIEGHSAYALGPKKGYWNHRLRVTSHLNSIDDDLMKSLALSFKEVCCPIILKHIKKGEEAP